MLQVHYELCLNNSSCVFQVHIFGASLGGFLGQKFAEYTYQSSRVHSMILCNSFIDTNIFQRSTTANLLVEMNTGISVAKQFPILYYHVDL